MLIELAVGDAYGAAFEYSPDSFVIENNDGKAYRSHPKWKGKPGRYTDDTQMSLAITEAILSDEPWTTSNLAKRFVEVFKRDERTGYAGRFYEFLKGVKDGPDFIARMIPTSDKSGGAMRAPVIGIYPSIDLVKQRAAIQASLTHNTPAGIAAAMASALMTHYFAYELGKKKQLPEFIQEHVGKVCPEIEWLKPYQGQVGAKGWMSVRGAMTALINSRSETELLTRCVAFTGDVDTVAAIAMAAASLSDEIDRNLSQSLLDNLEGGKYGYEYINQLDDKLARRCRTYRISPVMAPAIEDISVQMPTPVA